MPYPLLNLFPGGKPKCLTLSYDDGNTSDRRLVEIMNRYGIRGTFHLNSSKLGGEKYISAEEIADLFKGHEISAHSVTHPFLERIPLPRATKEMLDDRENLEKLAGYPVRGMSYPFGTYNQAVLDMLPAVGIEYARTVQSTNGFTIPENFLLWHPTCHHKDALSLIEGFTGNSWSSRYGGALFYVWGHSYEFADHNNWELIEKFCEKVSNLPEVWYATNIEIVDYVNAMRNLRFSVDATMVYNPSAQNVWFTDKESEKIIEVPAGKQLSL